MKIQLKLTSQVVVLTMVLLIALAIAWLADQQHSQDRFLIGASVGAFLTLAYYVFAKRLPEFTRLVVVVIFVAAAITFSYVFWLQASSTSFRLFYGLGLATGLAFAVSIADYFLANQ